MNKNKIILELERVRSYLLGLAMGVESVYVRQALFDASEKLIHIIVLTKSDEEEKVANFNAMTGTTSSYGRNESWRVP